MITKELIKSTDGSRKITTAVFKPQSYDAAKKYPLIIFLHGIGQTGSYKDQLHDADYNILLTGIPTTLINAFDAKHNVGGTDYEFIGICPQLWNQDGMWPTWYMKSVIAWALANLSIDPERIYPTGLSYGGGGVLQFATESLANAKQCAAMAACCPVTVGGNHCFIADAELPLLCYHAKDDTTLNATNSLDTVNAVNKCSKKTIPAAAVIIDKGGHGIWTQMYDMKGDPFGNGMNIYEFFLRSTASKPVAFADKLVVPVNASPIANAGDDITITLPLNIVTLDGSKSYDPDGKIVSWKWGVVRRTSAIPVTFSNAYVQKPVVSNLNEGEYVFRLTVTDDKGLVSTDDKIVTVNPPIPIVPSTDIPGKIIIDNKYIYNFSIPADAIKDIALSKSKSNEYIGKAYIRKKRVGKNAEDQFYTVMYGDNGERLTEQYTQKHNAKEILEKYFPQFEIIDETKEEPYDSVVN
jgi:predicted esterase